MSDRIREDHLRRAAYVYVRQSSLHQVHHHRESRQRQYDLTRRAQQLGFARVIVVDEDQGKSGTGLQDRPGFGRLLAAVCQGEVGAVLALEASRLARNNRDWYHLIDLCALTETLLIDADGIYEPRELNDRLLLGLKGSMAEFELGLLRQRAREAFEGKVRRGHALWQMPVGLMRNEEDRIEKIPDRQVQEAIEGVFRKFRELGSARQTLLWYRDEQIPLPEVAPGNRGHEVVWRLPTAHRIYQILRNPCYAGALAYGRTAAKTVVQDGRARKLTSRRRKPQEQWKVLLLDNHAGYITWDEYLANQQILESNQARRGGTTRGAAKQGPALLAGLLRCGRCGRHLFVAYSGHGGRVPRYVCSGGRTDRGQSSCLSLGGVSIEDAVVAQVLGAIRPAGIEAALAALENLTEVRVEKRRSLELALEKACYEAHRAQRQYDAVDPDNRLVAGELEARWNETLSNVARIEAELAALETSCSEVTEEQKQRLFELGNDLSALWRHPSASNELKKRILRTVLHEIIVDNDDERRQHILQLHWQGGVHTALPVRYNSTGKRRIKTDQTAIDLIRELSKVCSDRAIAATLNRLGYRTGGDKTWRAHSVHSTRHYYRIRNHRNGEEWLTIEEAAKELNVSHTVVRRLIREKILPATQVVESTPWIIDRKDLSLEAVRSEVQAVHIGRQLPRPDPHQAEIAF
jgi:excisionase family DNA binding protein